MAKTPSKTDLNKRSIAKSLYLDGEYTQEELAEKIGVSRQTIIRWMKAENWEEIKASLSLTPAQIIQQWNRQIIEINRKIASRAEGERFATPAEADAMNKIASSIQKMQKEAGISQAVSVCIDLLTWYKGVDAEDAKRLNGIFDKYIKERMLS